MPDRTYTVSEIDNLRHVCKCRRIAGTCYPGLGFDFRSHYETDHSTEEMVRTYMLAGLTSEDIMKEDKRKAEAAPRIAGEPATP